MDVPTGERSGKLVAELTGVSKSFGDKTIVKSFSDTILRGDKIGLIGPNGVGKTTLLKLILGELAPDAGNIRLGTKLQIAYFDQMRAQLDDNASLVAVSYTHLRHVMPERTANQRFAQRLASLAGCCP